MNVKLMLIGVGYLVFLLLSRGAIGGAARALRDWGRTTSDPRRPSTSS
jgi:hypothetical protein